MREFTVRGAAIDINDFERRLRGAEPPRKSPGDPLRELARLMHGEEQAYAARQYDQMFATEEPRAPDPRNSAPRQALDEEAFAAELRGAIDADYAPERRAPNTGHQSAVHPEEPMERFAHGRDAGFASADLAARHFSARSDAQTRAQTSLDDQGDWADDHAGYAGHDHAAYSDRDHAAYPDRDPEDVGGYDAAEEEPERKGFMRVRPWHAVTAIALIAASGLAWGFAKRGGILGKRDIATISAPDGPSKVPPAANADAGADKPEAAVLDRHENAQVKRVISHQEQAVEPRVEPRSVYNGAGQNGANGNSAPLAGSQPKKIKTVSVRSDGSLISSDAPPAVAKAANAGSRDAAMKHLSTTPAPLPRPSTTPHAEKTAKPKPPQKVAEAEDNTAATDSASKIQKGGFAVQFGAAANEAEAHALVSKVATKYGSQLGGHKPTFKMAKVGERTVYRVRVSGMSKESAASICGEVKSSGGSCFVAGD